MRLDPGRGGVRDSTGRLSVVPTRQNSRTERDGAQGGRPWHGSLPHGKPIERALPAWGGQKRPGAVVGRLRMGQVRAQVKSWFAEQVEGSEYSVRVPARQGRHARRPALYAPDEGERYRDPRVRTGAEVGPPRSPPAGGGAFFLRSSSLESPFTFMDSPTRRHLPRSSTRLAFLAVAVPNAVRTLLPGKQRRLDDGNLRPRPQRHASPAPREYLSHRYRRRPSSRGSTGSQFLSCPADLCRSIARQDLVGYVTTLKALRSAEPHSSRLERTRRR